MTGHLDRNRECSVMPTRVTRGPTLPCIYYFQAIERNMIRSRPCMVILLADLALAHGEEHVPGGPWMHGDGKAPTPVSSNSTLSHSGIEESPLAMQRKFSKPLLLFTLQ